MKDKYFQSGNFLVAPQGCRPSFLWHSLLKGQNLLSPVSDGASRMPLKQLSIWKNRFSLLKISLHLHTLAIEGMKEWWMNLLILINVAGEKIESITYFYTIKQRPYYKFLLTLLGQKINWFGISTKMGFTSQIRLQSGYGLYSHHHIILKHLKYDV